MHCKLIKKIILGHCARFSSCLCRTKPVMMTETIEKNRQTADMGSTKTVESHALSQVEQAPL